VSEPSLFICLFADFCQYKDVFVGTAVSTSEDKSFCAVEMDALSLLTIIIIIVIIFFKFKFLPSGVKFPRVKSKVKSKRKAEVVTPRR